MPELSRPFPRQGFIQVVFRRDAYSSIPTAQATRHEVVRRGYARPQGRGESSLTFS